MPGTLWHELHAYYRLAEMLECAVTAVSDDLLPNAVGISCYSTYSHALLLGLADPCAMTVRQIELTDRWLAMWARKVFPYAQQRETEGPVLLVDLDGGAGATLVASVPPNPAASMRFGYPGKLATSVRGRLKRLQSGANPAELQLGPRLQHRAVHHAARAPRFALVPDLPRRRSDAPETDGRALLPAACRPLTSGSAATRSSARIPRAGCRSPKPSSCRRWARSTDYDRGREGAEAEWAWERWQGTLRVARSARRARVRTGPPLDARPARDRARATARFASGHVTRVALGADGQLGAEGQLALTLRLWSGTPVAMALLPLSAASSDDPPLPALRLR